MNEGPKARVFWLIGFAVLLAAAKGVDYLFFGDDSGGSGQRGGASPTVARAPQRQAGALPRARPQSVEALRKRLEHLRLVERSAAEVRQTYAKVAIPYAEAMALLPTYFRPGSDPQAALEGAIRGLATESGLQIDSLLVAAPQRVGPGIFEGAATIAVRAGDSGAMLRFFADAGHPRNGTIWNGFQLSADSQHKQLSLAGELRALLIELAE